MKLIQKVNKLKDSWGFPFVWLPFGKPGTVNGEDGDYQVTSKEIQNLQSIGTLAGLPVYLFHPDEPVVNPANIEDTKPLGVLTDKYRFTSDGGGEILARLYSYETLEKINQGEITETSPVYKVIEGVRIFNHIAILPPGYARGGSKMEIKVEGKPTKITATEIYKINKEGKNMDEIIGQICADQQLIKQALADLAGQVKDMCQLESAEVEACTEEGKMMEEGEMYKEGFSAGVAAGETIATAKRHGYAGSDASEAQDHLITKAFPSIKIEGYSNEMKKGLMTGAIESLSKESNPLVEGKPVVDVPATVVVEGESAKTRKPRFAYQDAAVS